MGLALFFGAKVSSTALPLRCLGKALVMSRELPEVETRSGGRLSDLLAIYMLT
jgi:hypothetical protein